MPKEKTETTTSVERCLGILNLLSDAREDLQLQQIAARLNLHPSTAYRLLRTLVRRGYVEQQPDRRYRLGLETFVVGSSYLYRSTVWQAALPFLFKTAEQTGLTTNLGVWHQDKVCIIASVPSCGWYENYNMGDFAPAHASAMGKVLLAFGGADLLDKIEPLHKFTENTISTKDALTEELACIRQKGYAVDIEECNPRTRCVAAPVLNSENKPLAAMSVSGPVGTIKNSKIEQLATLVKERCLNIQTRLGYFLPSYTVFRR